MRTALFAASKNYAFIMPTIQTLELPRPLVNKILAHAQSNTNMEVCGLIGNDATGEKIYYAIDNISNNPNCRFLMDAPQQINAMKKMRDKQQQLFAIVHSHPSADAKPSQLDIAESNYKNVFYVIISLNTTGVLEMRAYTQTNDAMQEVELTLGV
jgi:[CysO sulfur-carrier protein]-S-L-cysteine hydrolase